MRSLPEIERRLDESVVGTGRAASAAELLALGEQTLEHWITARGEVPTPDKREGFRLLALHRQGAAGDPSFNACRETCRELVYYYNVISLQAEFSDGPSRLRLMALIANHLFLFVSGKLEVSALGDFCCASKPLHIGSGNS